MKVAIVHDQLQEFGGAERVLLSLKKIFPQASVYTLVYSPKKLGNFQDLIKNWKIKVSWFGKIPFLKNFYSPFRFLTPFIWESFDFSGYDLVISSSGSWMSKGITLNQNKYGSGLLRTVRLRRTGTGVKTKKPTIHISYIHHPPRYLYGYETAIEWQKYLPIRIYGHFVNHFLRIWDFESSQRPDFLIANSQETRRRIQKFYRRDAIVIYPPVNIPKNIEYRISNIEYRNYYITVSRLARAKHIDILIQAANKMKLNLKIVGTGRDEEYLKSIAGNTIEFLGNISDSQLQKLYLKAKAFLFSSVDEEFGIAPVEAMGYGVPVIAYRSGGIPEYLKDGVNGYLFDKLKPEALIKKIKIFESLPKEKLAEMKKSTCQTAKNFSEEKFKKRFLNFIGKIK